MLIRKIWIIALFMGLVLIGCGGGDGGKNSSFDTSGNSPTIGSVVPLDKNSTNVYRIEQNATDIVAYVKENVEKAFQVEGKDKSKITYFLTGEDSIMCWIDPLSGEVSFLTKTDYEKKSIYKFNVVIDDPFNRTIKRVTIYVQDEKNENILVATDVNSSLPIDNEGKYFITKWSVNSDNGYKLTIPTLGDGYNYSVDWGDGTSSKNLTTKAKHIYNTEDIYTVKITGDFPRIQVNNVYAEWDNGRIEIKFDFDNTNSKLLSIEQWGDIKWKSMRFAFSYTRLGINASDNPNLSNVTDMTGMFYSVDYIGDKPNFKISNWNTSHIENMSQMFTNTSFNTDISSWNVSNVKDMSGMFSFATSFNKNIGDWDVKNVTNMSEMFNYALSFNQDIGNWDVSNVTDMSNMFAINYIFNQDLDLWDVSNVTNMSGMFAGDFRLTNHFNGNIRNWDVSNVTNMSRMFRINDSFNHDISSWDVSNVRDMHEMFFVASSFNQDLNSWNVLEDINTTDMFTYSTEEPLPSWYKEGE